MNKVVLIHGLGGTRFDMWPISRRLKRCGFDVKNWGYRSIGNSIETHAERLALELQANKKLNQEKSVDFVTFSMGGIILRTMLSRHKMSNIGRVIMLAPPHRGSHTAKWLARYIGWATPSLAQISDAPDSFVNNLPNPFLDQNIEFGIVVAGKDRVIAPNCVELDGFRDIATVNAHHGILTWYSKTAQLVEDFLLHGSFHPVLTSKPQATASP